MYSLLLLVISSGFCIDIEKACDVSWDVEYLSSSVNVNHLVSIDMTDEDDSDNFDCFYKRVSQHGIPTVILVNKNKTDENVTEVEMRKVTKSYLYRMSSIAFILLMPQLNETNLSQYKYINVLRRYPKALITLVFYKSQDHLSKPGFEDKISDFMNYVLVKLKFIKVVGIVLNSAEPKYFTYDVNKCDARSYTCDVKWSHNNFNFNTITQQSRKLIENYPVRITIFHSPPTSIQLYKHGWTKFRSHLVRQLSDSKVIGKDGFLMADILKHLKFKPVHIRKPGFEPFGEAWPNGSVSGVLGDIVEQSIEISANSRFVTAYGVENDYYFLGYNHFDHLCAMVSKSKKVPVWTQVLTIYSALIWAILNTVIVMLSVLCWIHFKFIKIRRKSLFNTILETYLSFIVPIKRFHQSPHLVLHGVYMILSVIFVPMLQVK